MPIAITAVQVSIKLAAIPTMSDCLELIRAAQGVDAPDNARLYMHTSRLPLMYKLILRWELEDLA